MKNHFYKEKREIEMPPREEMIAYIELRDFQFMPPSKTFFDDYSDKEIFEMYKLAVLNHSCEVAGTL